MNKAFLIVSMCLCAIIISGCANFYTEESRPTETNVLNWNLGSEPESLDPGLSYLRIEGDIIANTHEGLVRERNGVVEPGIAERWDTSPDGRTITFYLRESQWSDASPLTAYDFEYSWKRAIDPATDSGYSQIWYYTNVENAYDATFLSTGTSLDSVGVRAIDNNTLEVRLTSPTLYFASLTSFYHFMPVKRSAVEAGPEGAWAKNPEMYVSNGPFTITSYSTGDGLTLEKNPLFWNADEVSIDRINVSFIDESSTAYSVYRLGHFDFINNVPRSEIPSLIAENSEFNIQPGLGTYYYNFNLDLPMWQDVRVRRALTLSIDRERIVDSLAIGGIPAASFVSSGFPDHQGRDFSEVAGNYGISTDDSQYAEARRLLAEAGFPGGSGFPRFTLLYNTSNDHRLVAELVQEMWRTNLGIEIDLAHQEWTVFQESRRRGNYELSRGGWLSDILDPGGMLDIFVDGDYYNDPNFNNADYNNAIARANSATDTAERFNALYEAQRILMTELPVIPVYHYTDYFLSSPRVQGWQRSRLGGIDFRYAEVVR